MTEKIKLLFLGTIASVCVSLGTLLVNSFFSDYALKAEVLAENIHLKQKINAQSVFLEKQIEAEKAVRDKEVTLLRNDLAYLKNGQQELKNLLRQAIRQQ